MMSGIMMAWFLATQLDLPHLLRTAGSASCAVRPLKKAWSGAADASDGCMLHALVIRVHATVVVTVSSLVSAVNYLSFMLCCVDIK